MRTTIKKALLVSFLALVLLAATGCSQIVKGLDVIGKGSVAALEAVARAVPDRVTRDAEQGTWSLIAPDGQARFTIREDWSGEESADVLLELDAAPFLNAGLDAEKLPEAYTVEDGMLRIGADLGGEGPARDREATFVATYGQILDRRPDSIGYHTAMDHYGVSVGHGNVFEWAKDLAANDKDIVFALNPEPLVSAGVDPGLLEGWILAKVPMDGHGAATEAEKLLKAFNLN